MGIESMRLGRSSAASCPRLLIAGIMMESRKTSRWFIGLAASTGLSSDASARQRSALTPRGGRPSDAMIRRNAAGPRVRT